MSSSVASSLICGSSGRGFPQRAHAWRAPEVFNIPERVEAHQLAKGLEACDVGHAELLRSSLRHEIFSRKAVAALISIKEDFQPWRNMLCSYRREANDDEAVSIL
ncbi:MAG TPA: hypothetical protein VF814_02325 [Casimicrobiaceae bacterium]